MAADIWSDATISLMASMLYFIDEDWTRIHEVLLNCTGFTGERHTGEAIRQSKKKCFSNALGYTLVVLEVL